MLKSLYVNNLFIQFFPAQQIIQFEQQRIELQKLKQNRSICGLFQSVRKDALETEKDFIKALLNINHAWATNDFLLWIKSSH